MLTIFVIIPELFLSKMPNDDDDDDDKINNNDNEEEEGEE